MLRLLRAKVGRKSLEPFPPKHVPISEDKLLTNNYPMGSVPHGGPAARQSLAPPWDSNSFVGPLDQA